MIELVFVIVVLGILASLAMGRMDRDIKQEAAETILSHIRLAQQLALRDNKHRSDNDVNWQTSYWQFSMQRCGNDIAYIVASDLNMAGGGITGIGRTESAINPMDGKYIYSADCENLASNETPSVLLTKQYGIKNSDVSFSGGCNRKQILFDYLGRPHYRNTTYASAINSAPTFFNNIMTLDCDFTFVVGVDEDNDGLNDTFTIRIEAETGYSYILGQEAS
jgi:type II secretory pathway pseudopilin PulG